MKNLIKQIKLLIFGNPIKWVKFERDIYKRYILKVQRENELEEVYLTTNGIEFFNFYTGEKASDSLSQTLNRYFVNYYYFDNKDDI